MDEPKRDGISQKEYETMLATNLALSLENNDLFKDNQELVRLLAQRERVISKFVPEPVKASIGYREQETLKLNKAS